MSGYVILGSSGSSVVKPAVKLVTKKGRDKRSAMILFGLPVLGVGLGWLAGRPLLGGIVGGTIGLAGCTVDNPGYVPGLLDRAGGGVIKARGEDGGVSADMATLLDLGLRPDLAAANPDMSEQPDMTSMLDMTQLNCVPTLSNVRAGDFTIRFKIQTTAKNISSALWQRETCDGSKDFWSVRVLGFGSLLIEINQAGTDVMSMITDRAVNDGRVHDIVIQRRNGAVLCYIDGVVSGVKSSPQILSDLNPILIATGHPCEGMADGTIPLAGTVTDVCLTIP